jgi:hypothetical protein
VYISGFLERNTLGDLDKSKNFFIIPESLSQKIGYEESLVLTRIKYWIKVCGKTLSDNQGLWIYNSQKQWQEQFQCFSLYKIKKIIYSLEIRGLLLSKKINAKKWNHTKWYSINEEEYNKLTKTINSADNNKILSIKNRPIELTKIDQSNNIQNNNYTNKYSSCNAEETNSDINNKILEEDNVSFDNKKNNLENYISPENKTDDLAYIEANPINISLESIKEEQTIAKEMIDIWNKAFKDSNNSIKAYSNKQIIKKLYNLHQNIFMSNLDEWKDYVLKVMSSKFLMGEKETNNGFKAVFPWLIKEEVVKNIINGAYGIGDRDLICTNLIIEAGESNKVDNDSIVNENMSITSLMLDIWNKTLNEDPSKIKLDLRRSKNLYEAYKFFSRDLSKWQEYCNKIASSRFLMGEATSFKASIDWCVKCEVIANILADKYRCGDRSYKKNYVPIKLDLLSSDPLWTKVVDKFKIHHGEAKTISWISKLDFEIIDQNIVVLSSKSKFICGYVETHYLSQLKVMFKEINMNISNVVLTNIINTKNICCGNIDKDQDYLIRHAC